MQYLMLIILWLGCSEKESEEISSDTAEETSGNTCSSMCEVALTCTELQDQEIIFGTVQEGCEEKCLEFEYSMSECTLASTDCDQLAECTRHTTNDDIGVCEEVCSLAIECGLTSDSDQCSIDCSMILGGFADAYYGAGLQCWASAEECSVAEQCPVLFY